MTYNHGITVTQTATSLNAPITSDSGIQVCIGKAPINQLAEPQKAVNVPVIAYDMSEAVKKLGYSEDFNNYELCGKMYLDFQITGIAPVIFINVLDPAKHFEEVKDKQLQINNKNVKIEEQGILLDTISITNGINNTDYVAAFDNNYNVVINILDDGALKDAANVTVTYRKLAPEKVTKSDVIGGYDTINKKNTGSEVIKDIYPKLNIIPGIVTAPSYSHIPEVNAVLSAKCKNINGTFDFNVLTDIDTEQVTSYDEVNTWKNNNSYTDKDTIAVWPAMKIGDNIFSGSAVISSIWAYQIALSNGIPYVSPSNKELKITGTCLKDGTPVYLDVEQANLLNGQGIMTAINLKGWRSWGNNTACYPENTDVKDRFIPCNAMFKWWKNSFIQTHFKEVDAPMNRRNIDRIVDTENIRANGFTANEEIAGAKIYFVSGNNPATSLINGKVKFVQKLTPYPPMEEIENSLEFDPSMLSEALGLE